MAGRLRLGHLFGHLRFHGVKIEARAFLHRRVFKEGLEFLAHHLLDEHKAPELILEPVEVLLAAFFRPVLRPAGALERIEAQVGEIRHVHVGLGAQPAVGLVNETVLVVVNAHRADGAFAEVEDFMARGRALAGDGGHLVVAVQMVLVGLVAELHALEQLVGDVRIAGGVKEGREPVHAGEDAVLHGIRRDMAGPAQDAGHAEAAFHDRPLALRERRLPAIGPGEDFRAVVGGEDDDGVVIHAHVLEMLHHQADVVIELGHAGFFFRPAVLRVHSSPCISARGA